jgi:hypothetical protein
VAAVATPAVNKTAATHITITVLIIIASTKSYRYLLNESFRIYPVRFRKSRHQNHPSPFIKKEAVPNQRIMPIVISHLFI